MKTKKSLYGTLGIVILLVLIALFVGGSRLSDRFGGKSAIELTVPQEGSVIYFDNRERGTTSSPNEVFAAEGLRTGTYSVIVAKEGAWPWTKDVFVTDHATVKIKSWNLPQRPEIEEVERTDAEYPRIRSLFRSIALPTEASPLSQEGVDIWIQNKHIIKARWSGENRDVPYTFCNPECNEEMTVFTGSSNITSIGFFKERNDVLIFTNAEGVFAIETSSSGTQNFQPIMRVNDPLIFIEDQNTLYIFENQTLHKLNL